MTIKMYFRKITARKGINNFEMQSNPFFTSGVITNENIIFKENVTIRNDEKK